MEPQHLAHRRDPAPHEHLSAALRSLNFYAAHDRLVALGKHAALLAKHAGDGTPLGIEALPSLPFHSHLVPAVHDLLVLDVGGSFTKGGIRTVRNGVTQWHPLFVRENSTFEPDQYAGHSLDAFAASVASATTLEAKAKGVEVKTLRGAAIVWSNALSIRRDDSRGLLGSVAQREGYRKQEWFIRDLKNGDPVSEPFNRALNSVNIPLSFSIIGNDTPLTLTSLPGAHAGMVASTGLNATVIKRLPFLHSSGSPIDTICNTEVGGRFMIQDSIRSAADIMLSPFDGRSVVKADTIECIVSGKFLPQIFSSHVVALAHLGISNLSRVGRILESMHVDGLSIFDAPLLSFLVRKEFSRAAARLAPHLVCDEVEVRGLAEVATEIVRRAGLLAGVVAWLSVSERAHRQEDSRIALDSTLAREMPIFFEELKRSAAQCARGHGAVSVELVQGISIEGGSISVPMLGAAHALDQITRLSEETSAQ